LTGCGILAAWLAAYNAWRLVNVNANSKPLGSPRRNFPNLPASRSLAEFLGVPVQEETPDHSSLSRIHGRLPLEVHEAMFAFVLKLAAENKLRRRKTVSVDSTLLEADAAMKSIVRRDTGEDWKQYVRGLAAEAGLENPSDEELRKFDKNRKDEKVSNDGWQSPNDPDGRIAKMKDGTTHLAYKAEHVVDLDTDLVLAAVIYEANQADTATPAESLIQAQMNIVAAESPANIEEVVADKGYHAAEQLTVVNEGLDINTYIPEPKRKTAWKWSERPDSERRAVTGNHRRRLFLGGQLDRFRHLYVRRCLRSIGLTGTQLRVQSCLLARGGSAWQNRVSFSAINSHFGYGDGMLNHPVKQGYFGVLPLFRIAAILD
jgi:transposase